MHLSKRARALRERRDRFREQDEPQPRNCGVLHFGERYES